MRESCTTIQTKRNCQLKLTNPIAEPNHRKKILVGHLMTALKKKVAAKATLTEMDIRVGRNVWMPDCVKMELKSEPANNQEHKTARSQRDGTHKHGGNMDSHDDGGGMKPTKKRSTEVCLICEKKGYSATRSKRCFCKEKNPECDPNQPLLGATVTANAAPVTPTVAPADKKYSAS